ncbi:MAG: hypothetical protein L0241_26570 [Planctomycetia bacterium]|nr:hypothetical protein [Planctomycetia bacterium]
MQTDNASGLPTNESNGSVLNSEFRIPHSALAIVGIGCLFPKASGPGFFWANVKHGVDGITEIPPTHWNPDDYFDADPKSPDMTYARRGVACPRDGRRHGRDAGGRRQGPERVQPPQDGDGARLVAGPQVAIVLLVHVARHAIQLELPDCPQRGDLLGLETRALVVAEGDVEGRRAAEERPHGEGESRQRERQGQAERRHLPIPLGAR